MKTKAEKSKDTPAKQHARFVEAAYKVEADQATDALDKAFKRLNPSLKPPRATKGGRKDG